jgi:UDP-N-acetylglucosamine 2-epimerase (non-hydrolysing)
LIGNVMIDSFEMMRRRIEQSTARSDLGLKYGQFALVTLHRPSNVDEYEKLDAIVKQIIKVASQIHVVFVTHPRTVENLRHYDLFKEISATPNVTLLDPLPYVDFMNIVIGSKLVITDSGGLQEETTYLDIPCLTMRDNTERPITITQGTNLLVSPATLETHLSQVLAGEWKRGVCPPLWDGNAAGRAVESLRKRIN